VGFNLFVSNRTVRHSLSLILGILISKSFSEFHFNCFRAYLHSVNVVSDDDDNDNDNDDNDTNVNAYDAVVMAELLQEFTRFM